VGTVYRRFPDKDALIDALFEEKIRDVERLATEALEIEDAWEAFSTFLRGVCALQARDRGLKDAMLSRDRGSERIAASRDRIAPIVTRLLRRAQEEGVVRADLEPFDIPIMHFTVSQIADTTRDVAPDYWQRIMTVLLDGLRAERADTIPMTAAPLDREQFATAMACRGRRAGRRRIV
jgi:AcrR family transcriptional regulator